ncbi:HAD family hydrolase [Embleya sp. NPDC001921]
MTRTPATTRRPLAVFDLDGTLVRGDSFGHFNRALLRRSRWRVVAAVLCLPIVGPLYAFHATRRHAFAILLRVATIGLPALRFEALAVFDRLFRSHSGNVIGSQVAPFVVGVDCCSGPVRATSLRATPFG